MSQFHSRWLDYPRKPRDIELTKLTEGACVSSVSAIPGDISDEWGHSKVTHLARPEAKTKAIEDLLLCHPDLNPDQWEVSEPDGDLQAKKVRGSHTGSVSIYIPKERRGRPTDKPVDISGRTEEWETKIVHIKRDDGQVDDWFVMTRADGRLVRFWSIKKPNDQRDGADPCGKEPEE